MRSSSMAWSRGLRGVQDLVSPFGESAILVGRIRQIPHMVAHMVV